MAAITTEEEELPIAFMPKIPAIKYHEAPLHFMSEPGISQQEYEAKVLSSGENADQDETIQIMCPDCSDGTGRLIQIKRSSLSRSPTFAGFFKSPHYLPGCEIVLSFMNDPAACWQIAQYYLEEGPDTYTKMRLRVYVTINYRIVDRFILLARLYTLARKLALPGLMDMAYEALIEGERLITPTYCVTIATLLFTKNGGFDKLLKDWCLKHVGKNFVGLQHIPEWDDVLDNLETELREQWIKLVEANTAILCMIEEEADDKIIAEMISDLDAHDQTSAMSIMEEREPTVDEVISKVVEEGHGVSEDGWEDVQLLIGMEDPMIKDTKARATLGLIPKEIKKDPEMKSMCLKVSKQAADSETAKARAVMGIDGGNGKIAGQRKKYLRLHHKKLLNLLP